MARWPVVGIHCSTIISYPYQSLFLYQDHRAVYSVQIHSCYFMICYDLLSVYNTIHPGRYDYFKITCIKLVGIISSIIIVVVVIITSETRATWNLNAVLNDNEWKQQSVQTRWYFLKSRRADWSMGLYRIENQKKVGGGRVVFETWIRFLESFIDKGVEKS